MLNNFILWFIVFGISCLAQKLNFLEQGIAFVWIHLIIDILMIAIITILLFITGDSFGKKIVIPIVGAISSFARVCIMLFITWSITYIFKISFTVAFQIITFGQCLCSCSKDESV